MGKIEKGLLKRKGGWQDKSQNDRHIVSKDLPEESLGLKIMI